MTKCKSILLDSLTMFQRCALLSVRNLDVLLTAIILPVMMMIMFVYLFGGAINVGDVDYVNYVVPGVVVLTIGYCASVTAISICTDMTKGVIDRFRSMPISKSSILAGHVWASVLRNCIATTLVIIVALLIGFRPTAGFREWLIIAGIFLLYMLVITWLSVIFGLMAKTPDGAGTFGFFILFLPYLSSGFVPTETMPAALRIISENQPLTPIIESLRSLFLHSSTDNHLLPALFWCIGLLLAAYAIAVWLFKKKATK